MRRLPLVLTALAAAVSVAALPAHAATPVLDGKKVKAFAFKTAVTDPQQHVLAETIENPVDGEPTTECVKPRCYAFPFVVKPARGVSARTPLSVKVSWTLPTSRFWLVLVDTNRKTPVERARCSTFYVTAGRSAVVRLKSVKPGKYAVWVTVQTLVAPDTVTGSVTFPAKDTVRPSPAEFPADLFVNGCNT